MAEEDDEDIPAVARPQPGDVAYDLEAALLAVIGLRAEVPDGAFTAGTLGTDRRGNGVVIDASGLVLTIGYLVAEAERVWLTTGPGMVVPGHVLAYDQATGFAVVQALGRLGVPALELAPASGLDLGTPLVVAGGRGMRDALSTRLVGKRPFAGYWEYLIDLALFTAPAHPQWGGSACIDPRGRLVGIGSLLVQEAAQSGAATVGNMVVPVDILMPILGDLTRYGQAMRPPRPWLGVYAADLSEGVIVTGLAAGGPAAKGGLEEGDLIVELGDGPVEDLAGLWRRLWAAGEPGARVVLNVRRGGRLREIAVVTSDRERFLRQPRLH